MSRSYHSATLSKATWALLFHHASEPANALRRNGVALMRHGRGPFLPLRERLLGFDDIGLLEQANLHRDGLESRRSDRKSAHDLRMAIARKHLRRQGVG